MHDNQHHGRRRQVVQIGREDKRSQRDGPQQALGVTGTNPFCDEIEAAIVAQQFHYRHRSQQEHHDSSSLAHIFQEHMILNKVFHRLAGGLVACQPLHILTGMLVHHKVRAPANIYYPAYGTQEHGDGSLVDTRQMPCGNQHIGYNQHGYNNQCHIFLA